MVCIFEVGGKCSLAAAMRLKEAGFMSREDKQLVQAVSDITGNSLGAMPDGVGSVDATGKGGRIRHSCGVATEERLTCSRLMVVG